MPTTITVRRADRRDGPALRALAQLDSVAPLAEPVLIAEAEGVPRAALSLADGTVAADPFHPTAGLVALLRVHGQQLARRGPEPRLRHVAQVLSPRALMRAAS